MTTQEKKDFLVSQGWAFTEKAHNIDGLHAWVSADGNHKIHNSGIKVVTDQAYSFASGEYIKKAETERKTQDILIAEMTAKIVAFEAFKSEFDELRAELIEATEKVSGDDRSRHRYYVAQSNCSDFWYKGSK